MLLIQVRQSTNAYFLYKPCTFADHTLIWARARGSALYNNAGFVGAANRIGFGLYQATVDGLPDTDNYSMIERNYSVPTTDPKVSWIDTVGGNQTVSNSINLASGLNQPSMACIFYRSSSRVGFVAEDDGSVHYSTIAAVTALAPTLIGFFMIQANTSPTPGGMFALDFVRKKVAADAWIV